MGLMIRFSLSLAVCARLTAAAGSPRHGGAFARLVADERATLC